MDYSSKPVQETVDRMLDGLERSKFFRGSLYTQCWLRSYLTFLDTSADFFRLDTSDQQGFISALKSVQNLYTRANFPFIEQTYNYQNFLLFQYYLSSGSSIDAADIAFEQDERTNTSKIVASRFILQPQAMNSSDQIQLTMSFVRNYMKENNFTDVFDEIHHINTYYVAIGESVSKYCT